MAGRERWVDTTDDVSRKKRRREEIRRTAYIGRGGGVLSGTGTSAERTGRTKDQVQQNRWNQSDGSCGTPPPPLTDSGGGGGDVNRRGGRNEDIRRTASIGRGGGVLSGTGDRTAQMIWMEDHVQRNQRKQSDGSCRAPLIPAGGGVRFTAVAEVHRPPSTDDEGKILAQASGQQVVGNTDPGKAPVMLSAPRGDTLVSKPKMHSAQMKVLDGILWRRQSAWNRSRQSLAQTDQPEYTGSCPESGEAIVVGAIGSAAPWFLTGWAHDVEIEFLIDTGCQVTILSATVFQRMCVVNPEVRSALQICRRRLVSADSSPLTVQGQLELDIVFPGLCCKMLFVVANIGSDGLLGTEAFQSYLPHQLDLRTGQLWVDGWSTLQLHQQRLTPDMDGLLTTSVVIPPDSEIVAKFSVSGTRPHGCVLVEPAIQLIEEYGILVGHTLVDASSGSGSALIVNPNTEVVVLPGLTFIGKLVPVIGSNIGSHG